MASYTDNMEDKKLSCKECGKGYSSKRGLDRHVKIHSGKLHFCQICNKGFTDAFDLKRHTATHKGSFSRALADLKYSCDICHISFVNKRLLSLHTKNDHFEKEPLAKPHKRNGRRLSKLIAAVEQEEKEESSVETKKQVVLQEPLAKPHKRNGRRLSKLIAAVEQEEKEDSSVETKKEVVLQEPTFLHPQQDQIESPKEVVVEKDFSQHFDALLWNYSSLTDIIEGPMSEMEHEHIWKPIHEHVKDGACCYLCSTIESGCQLEISFSS